MVTLLFQAIFWGSFLYWWVTGEGWPIAAPKHFAVASCVFLVGFVVTQGVVFLSFHRKWRLDGWRKVALGLLFPGAVQAAAGRPVWGSALNFALLGTVFVATLYCSYFYFGYFFVDSHEPPTPPTPPGMLYGIDFFISLSLLWLPLYLLNVWEVCRAPRGAETRAGKALLTFFLSLAFPGLGIAYVEKWRYWGYALFSFGAVFVLFLLGFVLPLALGMGLGILCVLSYAYLALPLVSLIDWYFSCLRSTAQDVKKP